MQSFTPAVTQFEDTWTGLNDESQQEISTEPLVPVKKGVRSTTTLCVGRVLSMHGNYGWIQPLQQIAHKDSAKHDGRIYLKVKDMRCGEVPQASAIVQFYLYVDRAGLGAEDCHVIGAPACNTDGARSWQKPWQQKPWQQKSWQQKPWKKWEQNWQPHWQKSQKWAAEQWESASTSSWETPPSRPEPMVMVRPELLLGSEASSAALRLLDLKQWASPDKAWCAHSEDDSTSAGDSASDVGEPLDAAAFGAPPGLEDCLRIPPPPGLELPPPGLELMF